MEAEGTELDTIEAIGALNFLTIDNLPIFSEGVAVDSASIIHSPFKGGRTEFPVHAQTPADPFLKQVNASGRHRQLVRLGPSSHLRKIGLLPLQRIADTPHLRPDVECSIAEPSVMLGFQQVAAYTKQVIDRAVSGEKSLCVTRRFESPHKRQRFLSVRGQVHNLFRVGRHLLRAMNYRILRTRAFADWQSVVCDC